MSHTHDICKGCPSGEMVKAIDCGIVVSEYKIHLRYNVYSRTNILYQGMIPFSSQLCVK